MLQTLIQKDINKIISTLGPYQPGTPGIKWTEDQASIIRSKILYLWKNWKETAKDFDFGDPGQQEPTGTNTEYVYDPERKLSTRVGGIYSIDAVGSSQIFFPTQNLERAY